MCDRRGALAGALGARDALGVWPIHPATFGAFNGQDSLIGRAAARWDRRGPLEVDLSLARSATVVETVRRYRLDPDAAQPAEPLERRMTQRIVGPLARRPDAERVVERVRDGTGIEWAVVLGKRAHDLTSTADRQSATESGLAEGVLQLHPAPQSQVVPVR